MRIDELDPKHKEFKEVILNHELTEEQLDEILPALALAGGIVARGAMAAGGALVRGAGAVARGVGQAASAVGRGIGQAASAVGRGASRVGQNIKTSAKNKAKNYIQNKIQNIGQNNNTGTTGSTGTIGTQPTQDPVASLQRGQEIQLPQVDPKNPNKVIPTNMKVKNVTGREVEFEPKKKIPGQASTVKYAKKDLSF